MKAWISLLSLCDGACRLAGHASGLEPLFARALAEHADAARLGAVAPVDAEMVSAGLAELAAGWDDPDRFPPRHRSYPGIFELDRRLAFCLGAAVQAASGLSGSGDGELSRRRDATILRRHLIGGGRADFEAFLGRADPAQPGLEAAAAAFWYALFQRALQESHTMIPDMVAIQSWIQKLTDGHGFLVERIRAYAAALYGPNPDPDVPGFYEEADPAVAAARRLEAGEAPSAAEIARALAPERNASEFARALGRAVSELRKRSGEWLAARSAGAAHGAGR